MQSGKASPRRWLSRDLDKWAMWMCTWGKSRFQAEGMASAKALRQHRVWGTTRRVVLGGSRICLQYRRAGFDPWVGKIPWRGNGNPLQYSCLGNPMHRGAWWASVHGATKVRHDWAQHKAAKGGQCRQNRVSEQMLRWVSTSQVLGTAPGIIANALMLVIVTIIIWRRHCHWVFRRENSFSGGKI